jgi:putative drug exporter of the RND superfamily
MDLAGSVVRRKKTVVILWAVALVGLSPLILNYSHFINYSINSNSLSNTESGRAQELLSSVSPQNSSLIVVLHSDQGAAPELANQTLSFQNALRNSLSPYYSSSSSAFSSYANFLNGVLRGNVSTLIRENYANFSSLSSKIYSFPNAFLSTWSKSGYSQYSILQTAKNTPGYNESDPYQSIFLNSLNRSFYSNPSTIEPAARVQNSTAESAIALYSKSNPLVFALFETAGYNVTNYPSQLNSTVAYILTKYSGHNVTVQVLDSVLDGGSDPGTYYVTKYGLLDAPSFVTQNSVSSDNSTYLVTVYFNASESYRSSNNFYPAQSATPALRDLAEKYFGSSAIVTGQGAAAYDTQSLSSSSGYVFGFTFIFLAIAVAIVLASFLAPILALVFVSIATALGYVSVYLTGVALGSVDFTVTYTLTAVILGVSTDYFVFILSRYREELKAGKKKEEALLDATRKAGFAVLVSGITVATSLGALSFVSDLSSWGPVLFISIILTVALETTLLPAVVSLIGPRLFLKRNFRNAKKSAAVIPQKSIFYKTTKFSERRKFLVIGVIALLAIPGIYFWFNVPTTYNFNEGLPSNLPSVKGLNLVDQKFGSNLIYPIFVVIDLKGNPLLSNGSVTPEAQQTLGIYAKTLLGIEGAKQVVGPMVNGDVVQLTNQSSQFIFNGGKNAYFLLFTSYDPYSSAALSLVKQLRSNNTQFLVGGLTSSVIDLQNYYSTAYTQLEIIIVAIIALVLGISFRSIKYPFISLSGVFISITWTTGIVYAISKYLLGQDLVFLIPIVLYVILTSLGNDFTVFILSRVKEEQQKFGFEEGLARAMVGSGAVVTALGLILAVSLGSLALVPYGFLEQIGIAFVVSLVLDTFVIRTFYFPSMILLLRGKTS